MIINIPKGTKDILPSESYKWQWLEKRIRDTAAQYGFKEIRTPMFEHTELFARGIGDTTDVVQKEMYTFEIAERSLTLKPEGTAGVVRSYIENKMYADPQPGKYYYIIPCFRYEKMQKGRQRIGVICGSRGLIQTRHQETRAYQNSCFELAAAMLMQKGGSEQVSPCVFFF